MKLKKYWFMKRILLLLFFITLSFESFSQWSYKTVKSDFDGTYKRAIVVGSGGEYPYKNPYLVVEILNFSGS